MRRPADVPNVEPPPVARALTRPRRRADVIARAVAGERVILDRRAGLVHQLNATASYIWDRCDGTASIDAIAGQIAARFAVDPATARAHVAATVARLAELRLLDGAVPAARTDDG